MIKFFRKIRQQLLAENKFSKYLIYAIGEIVLVVIGILIALWINNLNQQRKIKTEEQVVLKQLKNEFTINLKQLNSKIDIRNDMLKDFEDCLNYFANQKIESDSLFTAKLGSLHLPLTFDPIQKDLVGSGSIQIISNKELKSLLTNWTSDVHQLREMELLYVNYYTGSIMPFIDKTGIGRDILKRFWEDSNRTVFLLANENVNYRKIEQSNLSINYRELLKNYELESIISHAYGLSLTNNYESQALKKHINKILEILDLEIKK
ncbi:DUF6090 family protein [Aestuariivivens sediminis]|uniref:DUF6090 family protein n=1 Tax=Aestuariivivens sediminis TaxID=2913557 RepID=UPI001F58EEA8|nr:DUF6090 family protein [Aestuariivivens sediminis]